VKTNVHQLKKTKKDTWNKYISKKGKICYDMCNLQAKFMEM